MTRFNDDQNSKQLIRSSMRRGVSIIELLLALAISAMLLTATVAALDASFKSYAVAAESASTQAQTRMVSSRVMSLIRTSIAHEPMDLSQAASFDEDATMTGDVIHTNHIVLLDTENRLLRIWWDDDAEQLWLDHLDLDTGDVLASPAPQPILDGVTKADFYCRVRTDEDGVLVLQRASVDLQVTAPQDGAFDLERESVVPMRLIGSTMPRRLQ